MCSCLMFNHTFAEAVLVCMSERDNRRVWPEGTYRPPGTARTARTARSSWVQRTEWRHWTTWTTWTWRTTCKYYVYFWIAPTKHFVWTQTLHQSSMRKVIVTLLVNKKNVVCSYVDVYWTIQSLHGSSGSSTCKSSVVVTNSINKKFLTKTISCTLSKRHCACSK